MLKSSGRKDRFPSTQREEGEIPVYPDHRHVRGRDILAVRPPSRALYSMELLALLLFLADLLLHQLGFLLFLLELLLHTRLEFFRAGLRFLELLLDLK